MFGNWKLTPIDGFSKASSQVQPSRFMTATCPPMSPPAGTTFAVVTPLTRATLTASLSAL
jgi:hypothetical protein